MGTESSSPAPHVIRLRDPWDIETVRLPDGSSAAESRPSAVRFLRHFNRPTGLSSRDQVDLVIDRVIVSGRVYFNDTLLGELPVATSPSRFPIRDRLQGRNRVSLEFEASSPGRGLCDFVGEVRLEIRSGAREG